MPDIFKIIKSIQSTDKNELNHTLKNLLIAMLIRFGNRKYIDFNNSKIGEWIGEESEYVKNLLSKLKYKKYLKIKGRQSNRKIYLGPKIIRDWESRDRQKESETRDSQSPTRDSQSPSIKDKEHKENYNNVVVVLFEEYGWNFKNSTVELFSKLDPKKYLDVLEYVRSKAKSNPEGFIVKILESGSNVPKYVPPKKPQVDVKAIVKKDEETKFKPTEIGLKYVEKRRKQKEQQRQREKQREALRLQSEQRTNEKIIQTTTFFENEYGGCNGTIQRC